MTGPWVSGESLSPSRLNAHAGAATLLTGFSTDTLQGQSGLTVNVVSDLSVQNVLAGQHLELGGAPSSASGLASIRAHSQQTDYLFFQDAAGIKSNFLLGLKTGDSNASNVDGLNLFDASDNTLIVRFSSDSVRFYPPIVAPVFDSGGALASTYNAALFLRGSSKESQIQAAITAAGADGVARVYVPASMYPYSSGSVSFDTRVQMVREGGNWGIYDPKAYGASGNGTTNDATALLSVFSVVPINNTIDLGGATFKINSAVTLAGKEGIIIQSGRVSFASGISALIISDCERIRLRDIEIDGGSGNPGTCIVVQSPGLALNGNNLDTHISDCVFRRSRIGVLSTGANTHQLYVSRCAFIGSNITVAGSKGIILDSNDNVVSESVIQGYETAIDMNASGQQVLGNHVFKNPNPVYATGLSIGSNAFNTIVVNNNYFDGSPTDGDIVIEEVETVRGVSIVGNTFLNDPTGGGFIHFKAALPASNIREIIIQGNNFISTVSTKTNGLVFDGNVTTILSERFFVRDNAWRNSLVWSNSLSDQSSPTFASALSMDGMHGCTVALTLTGNITISNPNDLLTGGLGNYIRFVFRQDATGGRTVSFNGEWSQAWSDSGNSANLWSSIEFVRSADLQWVQCAVQTPYI